MSRSFAVTTAISNTRPAWQAERTERKRWIIEEFVWTETGTQLVLRPRRRRQESGTGPFLVIWGL